MFQARNNSEEYRRGSLSILFRFPVTAWTVPGVTRYHTGAWPLALDLFEEARLSGPAVNAVKARLLELGQTAAALSAAAQTGVTAGFLRPQTVSAF